MASESREIMEALGDKTRFSIVESVSRKAMTGDEIAESVKKARSTVESHLSVLLRLNLVSRRLEDRTYIYEATDVSKKYIDGRSNGNTVEAGAEVEAEAAAAGAPSGLISSAQGSAVSPPDKTSSSRPSGSLLSILFASALGIAWAILNVLVLPVHIFIPALTLGVIAGLLRRSVKNTLNMAIISSFFIAIVSYLLTVGAQPMNIGILFFGALLFMAGFGIAALLITRLFMKRAKQSWKFK